MAKLGGCRCSIDPNIEIRRQFIEEYILHPSPERQLEIDKMTAMSRGILEAWSYCRRY